MRTLTFILRLVRLGNQIRNLEPNLWYMLPGIILQNARPKLWNHRLIFCVVDLSLRVEPKWMLGLSVSIMGRSLLSIQMVLRNQRSILTPWNQLLLVLPFLEKRFSCTQMTWWMIPPQSPYLMKAWMAQTRWRRLRLHLRVWTEELLNLH